MQLAFVTPLMFPGISNKSERLPFDQRLRGRLCRLGLDEFGASAYHLLVVDDLSFLSGNDCIKKIVREFDHLFEIARMGNYARRVLEERHNLAKIY